MRFLTVTHFFESHGGGIERVAGHLMRALAAQGHACEWAASAADQAPIVASITTLPLACIDPAERLTGLPMPIPGPRGMIRLVRAIGRADAVIVHDALYATSIIAMCAARWQGKPVILFQHIAGIEFASQLLRNALAVANTLVTRPMLRAADQVVFISATVRRSFAMVRFRRCPRLLFNGVDPTVFRACPSERSRWDLPAQGRIAAFVGRFVEKKGLAVLRALAELRPGVTFVMAGSGPIDPAAWNLDNVRIIGLLVPADVAALFQSVDVLVLPSVGEGYPLVIQEAMVCGLPVICGEDSAQADPGASSWLNGVAIDIADPEGSARRIAGVLDRLPDERAQRGAMADYASAAYSWPAMARSVADIAQDFNRSG